MSVFNNFKMKITADGTQASNEFKKVSGVVKAFAQAGIVALGNLASQFATNLVQSIQTAGVSVIQTGADFQAQMSKVQAITGASADQLTALTAKAREMGETTKYSATESGQALQFLSMAGFKTEQAIAALPGTLDLAAASGIELGKAADIASNVLTSMRIPVEELGRVNDVLANTVSSSNVNMEMMAESMKYAAPLAAASGVSIEQLSAAIGMLGNAGIQGSMAGTALKTAISTLISPTSAAKKVFGDLGLEISGNLLQDLKALEQAGASSGQIMEIFGERAGVGMVALLGQGTAALETFTAANENATGRAKEMAEMMSNNLAGRFKQFQSVLEGLQIDIFDVLSDSLKNYVERATEWLGQNKDAIIDVVQNGWLLLQSVGNSTFMVLDSLMAGFKNLAYVMFDGAGAIDIFRGSGLFLIDTFSTITHTVHDVMTAFQKLFAVIAGPVEQIFHNIRAFVTGNWSDARINPIKLLNEIAFEFNQIDREAAKSRREIDSMFNEMRDKSLSATDAILKKNRERRKAEESLTKTIEKQAGVQQNLNKTVSEAAGVAESVTEEIKTQEQTFSDLTGVQSELENKISDVSSAITEQSTSFEVAANSARNIGSELNNLARSYETVTTRAEQAANAVSLFDMPSAFGSLSDTAAQWNQWWAQTYNNPSSYSSAPVSSAIDYTSSSNTGTVYNSSLNNIESQLSELEGQQRDLLRVQQNFSDYFFDQQTAETQLSMVQRSLSSALNELSSLQEDDVTGRISLYSQLFDLSKQYDSIQKTVIDQQKRSAQDVESLYANLVDKREEISAIDMLPVEKLTQMQDKFSALSTQIATLDFSALSTADQDLISSFTDLGTTYLDAASDVFKSSDNYKQIKDSVLDEFDAIATKLAGESGALTKLSNSSDLLKTNAEQASGKTSGLSLAAGSLYYQAKSANTAISSEGLGGAVNFLKGEADSAGVSTVQLIADLLGFKGAAGEAETAAETLTTNAGAAALNTGKLAGAAASTSTPFGDVKTNLDTAANNFSKTAGYIASEMERLKTAVENNNTYTGGSGPDNTGTVISTPVTPTEIFSYYSAAANAFGSYDLNAIYQSSAGGYTSKKIASGAGIIISPDENKAYVKLNTGIYSGKYQKYDIGGISSGVPGSLPYTDRQSYNLAAGSWASGAWKISGIQKGIVHDGEMVIRDEDRPAVQSFLSRTGRSEKYGAPADITPGDTMSKEQGGQIIRLLSIIADKITGRNDEVDISSLNRGLRRYQGVSG